MTDPRPQPEGNPTAMWGGRFSEGPDALFRAINDSIGVDWRLVRQDIAGSVAWARAIGKAGVLTAGEVKELTAALGKLADEVEGMAAPVDSGAEDVHSWVEQRLTERVGDLGRKLHTGRSRNDQVATDLRLWTKEALEARLGELHVLRAALVELGAREAGTPLCGYTHLQRAQAVTFGHWALAYERMLARDAGRLRDALARTDECPLGSGALAGTGWNVDRAALAEDLGFARATANSLDSVSDRDFVLEAISALTLVGVHLSRMAEDLIFYASGEAAFVALGESMTSGSSLMPQKQNPDALELVRAKAARLIGLQAGFAATVKGLPLAYNKDLQEDKAALFEAMDVASLSVRAAGVVVSGVRVNEAAAKAAAEGGYTNATDLADEMVAAGVPFRTAHERVGALVRLAIEKGVKLEELTPEDLSEHAPELGAGVLDRLGVAASLERRVALGGSSPDRVMKAAAVAREELDAELEQTS
ncbi:MAG: argininosuccinate lyase [Phycisphaerales bacterium]